jgi:hypothetical protein
VQKSAVPGITAQPSAFSAATKDQHSASEDLRPQRLGQHGG